MVIILALQKLLGKAQGLLSGAVCQRGHFCSRLEGLPWFQRPVFASFSEVLGTIIT